MRRGSASTEEKGGFEMGRVSNRVKTYPITAAVLCVTIYGQVVRGDLVLGTATKTPIVNSPSYETPPDISADGLELYFGSNRPSGAEVCLSDIWMARRASQDEPWGEPETVGPPISTSDPEDGVCIASDGLELYLSEAYPGWLAGCNPRSGGYGRGDLWVASRSTREDDWSAFVNLGSVVNTTSWEACPSISADGLSLFFCSDRPGGFQAVDLYVTTRPAIDAPWTPPVNLGPAVNCYRWQICGKISPDGRFLFFSAGTAQIDLFVSRRAAATESWGPPVSLGPAVNTPIDEYGPCLSPDGRMLYFTRGEKTPTYGGPNLATFDIWQAQVFPIVDFNGDALVDILDVCDLIDHWGTAEALYDIGPTPFGDGIVDAQDLIVLAEHLFEDHRLIAHWKLDEQTGTVAHDDSGTHHAHVHGDPLWGPEAGMLGGALSLDGADDRMVTDFVLDPAEGPFSAIAWVRGGAPGQVIISQQTGADWLMTDPSAGRLMTALCKPRGRSEVSPLVSDVTLTDGQWHHLALVWTGQDRVLYVDGVEVARDAHATPAGSSGELHIGCGADAAPATFWVGLIDDVRVYNVALGADEIATLSTDALMH
jgi:hypothetical protein